MVPKVRFKGFTDEWEQRKLGDVTDIKTGSRNHQDSVENGKYPFFVRSEKIERLDEYDFDTTAILIPGDGRIGEIFHYYDGKFALHQRVYKVDNFNGIDALFLLSLFRYSFRRHALRLNAQGTVPSLRLPMFTKWEILLPKLEEQEKIGQLFQSLDKTITLHEEKQRQLDQLKKALLQKMFADETGYPALRFKGFTEKWEQSYLKDIASVNSGRDYKHLNKGNIPVYGTGGYMLSVDKALSNTKDGIGIGRKGTINNPYILKAPFWTVDTLFYVIPYNVDLNFLYGIFQKIDWRKKDESTGVPSLSKENINKTKFKIPAISEQKEIGTIFQNLDTLITLHQHKIDNLKRLKRALLQKMFV